MAVGNRFYGNEMGAGLKVVGLRWDSCGTQTGMGRQQEWDGTAKGILGLCKTLTMTMMLTM